MQQLKPGDLVMCPGGHVGTIDAAPSPFDGEVIVMFEEFQWFEDGLYKGYSAEASTLVLIAPVQ